MSNSTEMSSESGRLRSQLIDHHDDRVRRLRWLLGVAVVALLAAGLAFLLRSDTRPRRLRISAGSEHGHRHELAAVLERTAVDERVTIELTPSSGSRETLDWLEEGKLDIGFVQGGLPARDGLRQVAVLGPEPLHLLVGAELEEGGLSGLEGRRINLSTSGSGTRILAKQVLEFAGLDEGEYEDSALGYGELRTTDELPDAVFAVAPMPSEVAEWLVEEHDYRLMPLPYGPALALRDRSIREHVVPANAYGVETPVPAEPLDTVATRMAIVARADVPDESVTRLMEAIYDGRFQQEAELSGLVAADVREFREMPLHPGAIVYLDRNRPMIDGEFVEGIENLRSFIVSGLVALFLLWRWYSGRQVVGWEEFLDRVTRVELDALDAAEKHTTTADALLAAEVQLSRIKSEALEQYSAGRLRGDETMSGFLVHVTDARNLLRRLTATLERAESHVDHKADGSKPSA